MQNKKSTIPKQWNPVSIYRVCQRFMRKLLKSLMISASDSEILTTANCQPFAKDVKTYMKVNIMNDKYFEGNACKKIDATPIKNDSDFSNGILLSTLMTKWLLYKKSIVKLSTHANFVSSTMNHINPMLGRKRISDINEGDIQDLIMYLYNNGRKDGKGGLSVKTIKDVILPLKLALDYAAKRRVIPKLEWDTIEYPKSTSKSRVIALSQEEEQQLIQTIYLNLDRKTCGILLTLMTGLRIGELCGLQMKDISLSKQTISINKTVQRVYDSRRKTSSLYIGQPKSESSIREIPVPKMLIKVMQKFHNEKRPENYFLTDAKKPTEPRTYRQYFERFLKRNNLPKIKFHELRHTFAVRAIEIPEFDIKSLSEILGHKNVSFTLNVYGRANIQQKKKCMELMNDLL